MQYVVLFLFLIGTIGVSFAMESNNMDVPFQIKLHQTLSVDSLNVEFLTVEDSRCPSDVTCVWAGRGSITLRIYDQTQYQNIILNTDENSTMYVDSYEINLHDLSPYPISTKDISEDYVATISISKNNTGVILSPLKQSKNGVESEMVICKSDLMLIIKNSDGSPACVKPETKARLFERGWAKDVV